MTEKQTVTVRIRGKEFRIRSDEDPQALNRIALHVDQTMVKVEKRTGAVDSLDVAMLTALNLAREVVGPSGEGPVAPERVRALTELAESALASESS